MQLNNLFLKVHYFIEASTEINVILCHLKEFHLQIVIQFCA